MRPRAAVAVAVAALAVLAGCNALLGPSGPSTTPTAGSTPAAGSTPTTGSASPAATPTRTAVGPPPGLGAGGVEDPVALSRAHTASLLEHSFTMRERTVVYAANGTRIGEARSTAYVAAGSDRYAFEGRNSGVLRTESAVAIRRSRLWANRSATFVALTWADGTTYQRLPDPDAMLNAPDLTAKSAVYRTFADVDTAVTDVQRRDGTVVYRLAADDGPHELDGTDVELTATVEASGVVRSLTLRYRTDRYGAGGARVVRRLRFERLDRTTVPRPAWIDDAVANTSGG